MRRGWRLRMGSASSGLRAESGRMPVLPSQAALQLGSDREEHILATGAPDQLHAHGQTVVGLSDRQADRR